MAEMDYSPSTGSAVRVMAVFKRFRKVYFKYVLANILPPVLEPLLFLLGLGVGLSYYMGMVDGVNYAAFLAPGMMAISPMFSASYECCYGTYMRMEYERIYDAILASPVSYFEMMSGELLWVSAKGAVFSLIVLLMVAPFGLILSWWVVLVPVVGFFAAVIYALMAMVVTSKVREITNFNFFLTGVLAPQFYFSGAVFPLEQVPVAVRAFCYLFPVTHVVAIMRALALGSFHAGLLLNAAVMAAWIALLWPLAYTMLKRRIVV